MGNTAGTGAERALCGLGRLLAWLLPDPCAGSAEIQRQMQDIGDEDEGEER
jgi:hypothetical protein